MADGWTIRLAGIEDAESIARVHVESAETTYRQICPEVLHNRANVPERARMWESILSAGDSFTLTASGTDGHAAGFASGGRERTGLLDADGELYAIYLLPQAQRRGLGTLLLRRFVSELQARGFGSMAVWVLAVNPSSKFYEARGGRMIGHRTIERAGRQIPEIAYGWNDLGALNGFDK